MNVKYEDVLFVGMLNSLANKTKFGIVDFDTYVKAPGSYDGWLVYNKNDSGRVACDMVVDDSHSDIVSYYDSLFPDVSIRVVDGDGDVFVDVTLPCGGIVIEHGTWYVYEYGILKDVEDYRAGRLKTYSLDEVGEMLGLDD